MPIWVDLLNWAARLILILLIGLSVWSVSILVERNKFFKFYQNEAGFDTALENAKRSEWSALREWANSGNGVRAQTAKNIFDTKNLGTTAVDRSVKAQLSANRIEFEKGLTVLASLGSNAPFIGLLGTVFGIIHAFAALGQSQSNTSMVMAGISEALIATAVGLIVAIPAVIGYNVYSRKIKLILGDCERLRDFMVSRMTEVGPEKKYGG